DQVEVEWREGPNTIVVQCGNVSDAWQFAIATSTEGPSEGHKPRTPQERANLAQMAREILPSAAVEARAAITRLEQKSQGRLPADDAAEEIAADLYLIAEAPIDAASIQLTSLANTLRILDTPD